MTRAGERALVFGCVTDSDDATTRLMLADSCGVLSHLAGEPIEPHRAASPDALGRAFAAGNIDLAWTSPTLLLVSPHFIDAVPLVSSVRQGETAYHGVLFVRQDSPYRTPLDLKGKTAAWVATTSAAGYIFPRLELAKYGLDPRAFFCSELFLDTHGNVARAVLSGKADVGGVYAVFENGDATRPLVRAAFLDADPRQQGRVLFATPPIPSDLVVAQSWLSDPVRENLTIALTRLGDEPTAAGPLRHVFGADSFVRHDPRLIASLRESVESGRELGLLE